MNHLTTVSISLALGLVLAGCNSGSRSDGSSGAAATTSGSTTTGGTTGFGTVLTDDHANDSGAATPLQLITTGLVSNYASDTGEIETPTDQDWFKIRLAAGVRARIRVDTQEDSAVLLVASDGSTVLTSNDDVDPAAGRLDSEVRFVPSQAADFYVVVQAGANAGPNLPTYTLRIDQN